MSIEITHEMLDRAACALWVHDFEDHMGFPARREAWPDQIENPTNYRTWAGIALAAALGQERPS